MSSDEKHNTQGVPSEDGSSEPDTASGGSPDESGSGDARKEADRVDPETGTDEHGSPIENPSGG